MALRVNINSYVTIKEADAYFEDRVNSNIWFSDTTTDQIPALISATNLLEQLEWAGTATPTTAYPLSFPRDVEIYDQKQGKFVELEDDRSTTSEGTVPQDIKDAQCELALWLLRNASMAEPDVASAFPLSQIGVGSISLQYDTSNTNSDAPKTITDIPETVYNIIKKYLGTAYGRQILVGG